MAKTVTYGLTSTGPFVGSNCSYRVEREINPNYGKACNKRARFAVIPYGKPSEEGKGTCAQHLSIEVDRVHDELGVPAVVQAVPVRFNRKSYQ